MTDTTKYQEILKLIHKKRVLIMIDGGNIYFSTHIKKLEIDYGLMFNQIKENCKELVEMTFYTAFKPNEKKQNQFFEYLESVGVTVFKKPIKVFKNDIKGNLDVELTVDAIQKIKTYDVLILLSGDGDFTYLVKTLESSRKTVLVFSFKGFTAHELMAEADNNYYLEDITTLWQSPKYQKNSKPPILPPIKLPPKKLFRLPSLPSLPNPLQIFKPKAQPPISATVLPTPKPHKNQPSSNRPRKLKPQDTAAKTRPNPKYPNRQTQNPTSQPNAAKTTQPNHLKTNTSQNQRTQPKAPQTHSPRANTNILKPVSTTQEPLPQTPKPPTKADQPLPQKRQSRSTPKASKPSQPAKPTASTTTATTLQPAAKPKSLRSPSRNRSHTQPSATKTKQTRPTTSPNTDTPHLTKPTTKHSLSPTKNKNRSNGNQNTNQGSVQIHLE